MKKATENLNPYLKEKISNALDQQADTLDDAIVERLQKARKTALLHEKSPVKLSRLNLTWLSGAGAGLALAGVLGFVVIPHVIDNLSSTDADPSVVLMEDFEVLSDDSDLDLYTQLDFYQWLDDSLGEATL